MAHQSVSIVLIETNGTIKTLKTKEVSTNSLYKKCGFRVSDDFVCRHTWQVYLKNELNPYCVSLWAKKNGKANFENKYDFPPPMDKDLFFGTCAIIRTTDLAVATAATATEPTFIDFTKETWLKIYEHLFGGFEDLGDEDEYSEDELANVEPALLTAHGYLKDDFVVSDKEALESGEVSPVNAMTANSDDDAEMGENANKKTHTRLKKPLQTKPKSNNANAIKPNAIKPNAIKPNAIKPNAIKPNAIKPNAKANKNTQKNEIIVDDNNTNTSELEEEMYTFSDDDA